MFAEFLIAAADECIVQNPNMADTRTIIKLLYFLKKGKSKHHHSERRRSQQLWRLTDRAKKCRW